VTNAWKDSDKSDAPKEFETLFDFKMAMLTMEGALEFRLQNGLHLCGFGRLRRIRLVRGHIQATIFDKLCG
jgi:hypothetical protein